jgi:predicted nucleic acid-binding protein
VIVYADTAGLFAYMVGNDLMHARARANFAYFQKHEARILTSSYVILETLSLLQRRVGMAAVVDFQARIQPLLDIVWVDGEWHARAMQRLILLNRRNISLVDCLGFEIMEARGIDLAFTFDSHFAENGFTIAAFDDTDPE